MVSYNYEIDFSIDDEDKYTTWIESIIESEGFMAGEINYIFCSDEYLHKINIEYLDHDTYTDIISFDYTEGRIISGDIFISIDRVRDNALDLGVLISEELLRVMSHGILHYCGYLDKTDEEERTMRSKEDEKIRLFHVE